MRKLVLYLAGIFLVPLISLETRAQVYDELDYFQDSAQELSILFRGKQAEKYEFPFNGNCYWSGPQYGKGEIMYLGKLYRNLDLNLDAVLQSPLVRMNSGSISIGLATDDVEYMVIDGSLYENLALKGRKDAESGFYQLLAECPGYKLYKKVAKKQDSSVDVVNGPEIGYEDPYYKYNVHTFFKYMPAYYLVHNGGPLERFKNKNALLKMFPERRKEIKKHMDSTDTRNWGIYNEKYYVEVINYLSR